ncbi:hypothetical protein [Leclercia adecarboxylata]|uniref:hypothetical protein n=1 Tax=Leclercia adecarboxylata TaxID=83655 RepID=UPI001F06D51F|nr:hypothetical protein [Leclercia adecarboxylata]MCH2680703.1 hypothetical protein [Leclercia adecarboxylata]
MHLTTRQLVAEAHRAARSLPPESAKLVTELATRLDVTRAALCESLSERDRLAVENAALKAAAKKVIKLNREHAKERHGNADIAESWHSVKVLRKAKRETPATDAFLAEVRAQGGKVTLPTGYLVRPGHPINEAERGVMIPKDNGPWLSRHDVEHALRVAGIRINGED